MQFSNLEQCIKSKDIRDTSTSTISLRNSLILRNNIAKHTSNLNKIRRQFRRRVHIELGAPGHNAVHILVRPALDLLDGDVDGDVWVEGDFRAGDVAEGGELGDFDGGRLVDGWLGEGVGCADAEGDAVVDRVFLTGGEVEGGSGGG